jgi:Pvc16 N-terminal domain
VSTTLALAAVTAVMKYLLIRSDQQYGVRDFIGGALTVTSVAPDRIEDDELRLNLFMFRAMPNPGWAAQDYPSRDASGERISNPYLALDMHYVVTAHGTTEFQNEVLLGYAMQIFHEHPVLARAVIREALRIPDAASGTTNPLINSETTLQMLTAIAAAGLADQIEQIKLAPYKPSLEEISQVWSALQTSYRPTASYTASVVLVRSSRPARQAPPVRSYGVYVYPFRQPVIETITAAAGDTQPILAGSQVRVGGQALRGTHTRVALGATELNPADAALAMQVSDSAITFTLPPATRAGLQGLQVRHPIEIGSPPTLRGGTESNVAAFMLQPRIQTDASGAYVIAIVPPTTTIPRLLRTTLTPNVAPEQRAMLYLNQINLAAGEQPHAYSIEAITRAAGSSSAPTLEFPISDVAAGRYLVRVQIDGAESPLDFQEGQGYVAPAVTL